MTLPNARATLIRLGMPDAPARTPVLPPAVPANKFALPRTSLRFMPRLERESDHPRAWEFPAYLSDPDTPWLRELRDLYTQSVAFPASISPQSGLLLHALVLNLRPRVAVETGTFLGASTLWMASALTTNARLFSFDDFGPIAPGPWRESQLHTDRVAVVRDRLARAGLADRVQLTAGDSASGLCAGRDRLRERGGVDLALLDGDHTVEGATRDLWSLEPVLNTGGYILLHDTYPEQGGNHEGPRHVVNRINEISQGLYERCELHLAPLNYGLAVLRRVG